MIAKSKREYETQTEKIQQLSMEGAQMRKGGAGTKFNFTVVLLEFTSRRQAKEMSLFVCPDFFKARCKIQNN